jgi:hypothetical protein
MCCGWSITNCPNNLVVDHYCNLVYKVAFQDSSLHDSAPTCMEQVTGFHMEQRQKKYFLGITIYF